ncbi:TM0106 family RecB-like putative nuclease [Rhodococcus sp. NBC_00297]|uniref:TM0106 family RecB-like putative nuclease n=1 Tax=Rhodococcus sp. NBC_00297 TaxID=2976005 RepID=UPI002E284D4C|nr:TM0106 family RecB-like putative nuclease [Rhodococcus sp. NBC_00297]
MSHVVPPPAPASGPSVLIDASSLTRCRHRVYLDTAYRSLLVDTAEDAGVQMRREAAAAYRAEIRDTLVAADPQSWVVVSPSMSRSMQVRATRAACESGVERIWNATFADDEDAGRRGRCDMLVRDPDGGYIPVLVVNHKVTDPGSGAVTTPFTSWAPALDPTRKVRPQLRDQLAAVHVHRLLGRIGQAGVSARAGVIGFGAEVMLVHDLTAVDAEYDTRFGDRLAIASGSVVTSPSKVSECRSCPWWSECGETLRRTRDVSLVAAGSRADALRSAGIVTIDDLADWTGGVPDEWPHGDFDETVVIARAWIADLPLVRRRDTVTVQRADVEVDVDMESYQEHGAYMWGTLLDRRDGAEPQYRAFVTWEPVPTMDEARSFGEFWSWMQGVRADAHAEGLTFAAYCYSRAAEDKWLLGSARRFAGMPGVPTEAEVREFIDGPDWVDIYIAVSQNFVCPSGKGLKKVAPVAGFHWRDDEAGGEASMAWYRRAVGYDGDVDASQRTRLLEYNEDDVQATRALRVWMDGAAAREIPTADDLGGSSSVTK